MKKLSLLFFLLYAPVFAQNATVSFQQDSIRSVHQYFLQQYKDWDRLHPELLKQGGPPKVIPLDLTKRNTALKHEVFGYMPYWWLTQLNNIDFSLVSTIAYFDVAADGNGGVDISELTNYSSQIASLLNIAHTNGIRVVLCMTNFTPSWIASDVSNPSVKKKLIDSLFAIAQHWGFDGINVDFESIPSNNRDNVTSFMRDLAAKFHDNMAGSSVSCAPTDYDFRQGDWDVKAISQFVDVIFMQGYGYGYSGGTVATPVGLLPDGISWGHTNITTLINSVLEAGPDTSKIILGLPHFGYDWPTISPNAHSRTSGKGTAFYYPDALLKIDDYGRQWDSDAMNPWYRYQVGTQWHQGWYDDAESMAKKYAFAASKNLGGVGMWSLGMDQGNHDIWDALQVYATGVTPLSTPRLPRLASVVNASTLSEGKAVVWWYSNGQSFVKGYRLFMSRDGITWSAPVAAESTLTSAVTSYTLSGLGIDAVYYFKLVAVDSSGTKISDTSDTYGVRTGSGKRYLIVDGFDRYGGTGSWQKPEHDFARYYGDPLASLNRYFDCAANETVAGGNISLSSYDGVIWFDGDESTANETFNTTEQNIIQAYLQSGGKMFVTGSEIGWDLYGASSATSADKAFYNNYLKANWGGDKSNTLQVTGVAGTPFAGDTAQFGQTYPEDYPDYFSPAGGAVAVLQYDATQTAGIYYAAPFGTSANAGRLMYIGFPFETIASLSQRTTLMSGIVTFLESTTTAVQQDNMAAPKEFTLQQNYPNPFNPTTHLRFTIADFRFVTLKIYDVLGREAATLVNERKSPGTYEVSFDGSRFASGVYFYTLRAGNFVETKKMLMIK
jgi:spore germination protein YaaH